MILGGCFDMMIRLLIYTKVMVTKTSLRSQRCNGCSLLKGIPIYFYLLQASKPSFIHASQKTSLESNPVLFVWKQFVILMYPSSHNHGSQKWVPPVVVTFQIQSFSTSRFMGERVTCNQNPPKNSSPPPSAPDRIAGVLKAQDIVSWSGRPWRIQKLKQKHGKKHGELEEGKQIWCIYEWLLYIYIIYKYIQLQGTTVTYPT